MDGRRSWGFREGEEIVPRRVALALLGGGRRYEAYLVWDDDLATDVVAKIVRPNLVEDAGALAGLAGEARMLALLRHPVIVRAFDADVAGERPHLVLEFLDGPRLSTLIRRYGVALEQLLPLAVQLCSALHYLGRRGVVHLDVKPRNVVMGALPRLIDLSVARTVDEAAAISGPVGTEAYMAPEQCDPARYGEIGPATDVWGLGVTLFEALARTRPFPAGDPRADALDRRYPQLAERPAKLPRSVPAPVADAVLACLADVPAERPAPRELSEQLTPVGAALPPPRIGRFRPAPRPAGSRLG